MYSNKMETVEHKTLAAKIDFEWSVYSNKNSDFNQKNAAKNFLIYAFDLRVEDIYDIDATLNHLMKDRERYKAANPEYIPGKSPKHLDLSPEKLHIDQKNNEFLNVNPYSKRTDENRIAKGTVKFLSAEERNEHRVLCHGGLFKMKGGILDTQGFKSHGKSGFAAFTLNANGELSIFNHDAGTFSGLVHSSMNSGAPVVCAGELKIINGELIAINTHSGHYMPSLYNVYRMLQHLSSHDIDLSKADVITISDPSSINLPLSRFDYSPTQDPGFYKLSAKDMYKVNSTKLENYVENLEKKLQAYSEKNFFTSLIEETFTPKLTKESDNLAQNFLNCIKQFKKDLKEIKTDFQLQAKIVQLEKIILNYEKLNNLMLKVNEKPKNTGHFSESIYSIKKQFIELKNDNEPDNEEDEYLKRKMRSIS